MRSPLPYFFITVKRNDLGNISLIEVWNHRVVCQHMDCRLEGSLYGLWEFVVPYSNPVILTTKNIFSVSYSIYGIAIKFWTFWKKKKIVIANVFPKLATVQGLVTPLSIQRRLKTCFDSQHVERFKTLVKSSWAHFYQIFSSLWGEMIRKIFPWLKFEIIGYLVNAWSAD